MGHLAELSEEYAGVVKIMGLSADLYDDSGDGTMNGAREILSSRGAKYDNIVMNKSVITTIAAGVRAVPVAKFYDSDGVLVASILGSKSKESWINVIETILNEKA